MVRATPEEVNPVGGGSEVLGVLVGVIWPGGSAVVDPVGDGQQAGTAIGVWACPLGSRGRAG